ncbi:hypothetical protein THAOC_13337 [Thalassiosira oceanica]|uniref:Uncharacterized protein n=1 Tax=Thalassiosira oceanica TaxID=159749 RepID=K0SHZ5_THAOC|nr:hypothetical protein THAOC_13337 [Thalassiosira oceanica]|eukprot:EJK65773.1 hypothetical protein THAOC_13337 [Thalassiosira oceanica]
MHNAKALDEVPGSLIREGGDCTTSNQRDGKKRRSLHVVEVLTHPQLLHTVVIASLVISSPAEGLRASEVSLFRRPLASVLSAVDAKQFSKPQSGKPSHLIHERAVADLLRLNLLTFDGWMRRGTRAVAAVLGTMGAVPLPAMGTIRFRGPSSPNRPPRRHLMMGMSTHAVHVCGWACSVGFVPLGIGFFADGRFLSREPSLPVAGLCHASHAAAAPRTAYLGRHSLALPKGLLSRNRVVGFLLCLCAVFCALCMCRVSRVVPAEAVALCRCRRRASST